MINSWALLRPQQKMLNPKAPSDSPCLTKILWFSLEPLLLACSNQLSWHWMEDFSGEKERKKAGKTQSPKRKQQCLKSVTVWGEKLQIPSHPTEPGGFQG